MSSKQQPKREKVVSSILNYLDGPISSGDLIEKTLKKFKSTAKNPKSAIRSYLREINGSLVVLIGRNVVVPIDIAAKGVSFIIRVGSNEVAQSAIFVESLTPFYKGLRRNLQLYDKDENKLKFKEISPSVKAPWSSFPYPTQYKMLQLKSWFQANNITIDSNILVTTLDYSKQHFSIEVVEEEIAQKARTNNIHLANIVFEMLEKTQGEYIEIKKSIFAAYYTLKEKGLLPLDYWRLALREDGRMTSGNIDITYSEKDIFSRSIEEPKLDDEEFHKIYTFKISLKHQLGIWRRLEIQGGDDIYDFTHLISSCLQNDIDPHGRFWKLMPRGKNKRYREVDIANVGPWGYNSPEEITIASLELEKGSKLKYVYECISQVECIIELEKISSPEKKVLYPRELERNKPKYQFCSSCKNQTAVFICSNCTLENNCEVVFCDDCFEEHEYHNVYNILY